MHEKRTRLFIYNLRFVCFAVFSRDNVCFVQTNRRRPTYAFNGKKPVSRAVLNCSKTYTSVVKSLYLSRPRSIKVRSRIREQLTTDGIGFCIFFFITIYSVSRAKRVLIVNEFKYMVFFFYIVFGSFFKSIFYTFIWIILFVDSR